VLLASAPYFGWNVIADLDELFRYSFMRHAFSAGTAVAIVAGVVGYFVVLRASSFAAHALSHIGFAGATGAVLLGLPVLAGLLAFTVAAGAAIGALGSRIRGRDVTIGIVLAWSLGLGALFLSLYQGYAGEAVAILFGQILSISFTDAVISAFAAVIVLAALSFMYRPLLFTSIDEEVAEARGVPVRAISVGFMILLAVAVSQAVQVVGVLLIFSLIVSPAAIAQRLTTRPLQGLLFSAGLALIFTWLGLGIAYYLPYPVSFFITTFAFAGYLVARFLPQPD
jgi:zinc/manganese transport system permease protein